MKKPRNRAAQDATLINIRKLNVGFKNLVVLIRGLAARIKKLEQAR